MIPNGVDTARFSPSVDGSAVRRELKIGPTTPVAGIVAALRPEKNHELFLRAAARVHSRVSRAHFVIVGDGPQRAKLESVAQHLNLVDRVHFLGTRHDIAELLSAFDVFVLTSKMEANPVSILEAMATGKPVVAPRAWDRSPSPYTTARLGFSPSRTTKYKSRAESSSSSTTRSLRGRWARRTRDRGGTLVAGPHGRGVSKLDHRRLYPQMRQVRHIDPQGHNDRVGGLSAGECLNGEPRFLDLFAENHALDRA